MTKEKIDYLNRDEIIDRISEIIKTIDCNEYNRSFAIDGKWGIGKSFIADKIAEKFANEKDFIVFKFNAWANDYYTEPLIAIVTTLIDELNEYQTMTVKGITETIFKNTIKSLYEILKTLLKSANIALGLDRINQIGDEFKQCGIKVKKHIESRKIENNVDNYKTLKQTLDKLRECLSNLNKKIIFIIDEIDRCLPDYAVKVLERTHHLFEGMKGSLTIYSMDKSQLENLIKNYYGQSFSIDNYLEKFIEFSISIDVGILNENCKEIFNDYFTKFNIETEEDKNSILKFFKLLTEQIDIRKRLGILKKIDKIHEIFVKEKCEPIICYFEIFYIIFCDYYREETKNIMSINFNPDSGSSLNESLQKVYKELFGQIQLSSVQYIGIKKYDTIEINSMKEYNKLLFFYLRYIQNKNDVSIKLMNEDYSKIKTQVYDNYKYIDKFIEGLNCLR